VRISTFQRYVRDILFSFPIGSPRVFVDIACPRRRCVIVVCAAMPPPLVANVASAANSVSASAAHHSMTTVSLGAAAAAAANVFAVADVFKFWKPWLPPPHRCLCFCRYTTILVATAATCHPCLHNRRTVAVKSMVKSVVASVELVAWKGLLKGSNFLL